MGEEKNHDILNEPAINGNPFSAETYSNWIKAPHPVHSTDLTLP